MFPPQIAFNLSIVSDSDDLRDGPEPWNGAPIFALEHDRVEW